MKVFGVDTQLMHNQDGNWQLNPDGYWTEAIPMPLFGLRKQCQCGKKFFRLDNYHTHYIAAHTDGKKYSRDRYGLHEVTDD